MAGVRASINVKSNGREGVPHGSFGLRRCADGGAEEEA